MTPKRIFVLDGHPAASSLTRSLAESYANAARGAGHQVRLTHLHDLEFDPDYGFGGYVNQKPLEPGLEQVLQDIEWAEHVVMATPVWWGGFPAKLKGLIDRAFLPGRTFDTRKTTAIGLPAHRPGIRGHAGWLRFRRRVRRLSPPFRPQAASLGIRYRRAQGAA